MVDKTVTVNEQIYNEQQLKDAYRLIGDLSLSKSLKKKVQDEIKIVLIDVMQIKLF